jgi:hypothetical protein
MSHSVRVITFSVCLSTASDSLQKRSFAVLLDNFLQTLMQDCQHVRIMMKLNDPPDVHSG